MKRPRFLLIFGLVLACAGFVLWPFIKENNYTQTIAKMSPTEVEAQVRELNRLTIPPNGTPLHEIENVYGQLKSVESSESFKGNTTDLSSRELLPRWFRTDSRAFLFARVGNGVATQIGINHLCVAKGRKQIGLGLGNDPGQPQETRQLQRELEQENRGVLLDLMLIRDKYGRALNNARWNRS